MSVSNRIAAGILLAMLAVSAPGCAPAGEADHPATPTVEPSSETVTASPTAATTPTSTATSETMPTSVPQFSPPPLDCDGLNYAFEAVGADSNNGIYIACTTISSIHSLALEGSDIVPTPWRITDFDISASGHKLVLALGQGSSINGKGQVILFDLRDMSHNTVYEVDHLISEIEISAAGDYAAIVVSHPGYASIMALLLDTGDISSLFDGESFISEVPIHLWNLDWSPAAEQLLFKIALVDITDSIGPDYWVYNLTFECDDTVGQCFPQNRMLLEWQTEPEHPLTWGHGDTIMSVIQSGESSTELTIELRDTTGNLLQLTTLPTLESSGSISGLISISDDNSAALFTYDASEILLVDLDSGAFDSILDKSQHELCQIGPAILFEFLP